MSGAADAPPGPLAGLTVLDLSRVLAGPWASQILGDLGAEVIKIEQPGRGDDTRHWGPPFHEGADGPSDAAYFFACNRNKKSVAVDFGSEAGRGIVRRLAAQADIVIENFKAGGLAKYGLDYRAVSADNPSVIYCSVTGFGQYGPHAGRGGYDFLIQGMSGLMSVTGRPDDEPGGGPMKVGIPASDIFTGQYAAIAILAAVAHRQKSGEGQHIDCALLDSQLAVLVNQGMNYLVGGQVPGRRGNAHPNVVPYRDFATADGSILVAVGNDGQFRALCAMLGREDLAADPRFADNRGRSIERAALERELAISIAGRTSAALLAEMEARGIPGGPVNTIDTILADPHVAARGLLHEMTRDDGSTVRVIGFPAQLSRSPASYRAAPPRLGADTAGVLGARLGLSAAEMDALAAAGVIGGAASSKVQAT